MSETNVPLLRKGNCLWNKGTNYSFFHNIREYQVHLEDKATQVFQESKETGDRLDPRDPKDHLGIKVYLEQKEALDQGAHQVLRVIMGHQVSQESQDHLVSQASLGHQALKAREDAEV